MKGQARAELLRRLHCVASARSQLSAFDVAIGISAISRPRSRGLMLSKISSCPLRIRLERRHVRQQDSAGLAAALQLTAVAAAADSIVVCTDWQDHHGELWPDSNLNIKPD